METVDWTADLLNPTTVIGVIALIFLLVIWWRKDAANPAQSASYSVVTSSAEYAGDAFRIAQEAMKTAQEASDRALQAERRAFEAELSSQRCANTNTAFADYCMTLIDTIETLGHVVPRPPRELVEWIADSETDEPSEGSLGT